MDLRLVLLVPPALGAAAMFVRRWGVAAVDEWHRDRVREKLGEPVDPSTLAPGAEATLAGTLRFEAGLLVSYHPWGTQFLDEANVYAVSVVPDAEVVVVLGEGRRAIVDGPAQVLVGDVESEHEARIGDGAAFGVSFASRTRRAKGQFRALHDGARVRVRGRVAPAPDGEAGHYREAGHVLRVAPRDEPGAVLLAAEGPTETRFTRRAVDGVIAVVVLVAEVVLVLIVVRLR